MQNPRASAAQDPKPHDAWFEKSIWLIDALCDATRESRSS